jgi:6-phosphogluconolactonase
MYLGAYTFRDGKGVYAYRFHPATGKLTPLGLAAQTLNPSFLAIHPNGRFLYAVNEFTSNEFPPDPKKNGSTTAFSVDRKTGKLTALNTVSFGGGHLAVDKSGKTLVIANYHGDSTVAFPIHADGTLGEASSVVQHSGSSVDPQRQAGPHPHCVTFTPENRFVIVSDRGLDKLLVYKLDAAASSLSPHDPPFTKLNPGSGPRHFAFRPDGKFGYSINEISSTVTALGWDGKAGTLTEVQTIPSLPSPPPKDNAGAEVVIGRRGRFLYVSNRGHDSIDVFSINGPTGKLTSVQDVPTRGRTPRSFAIDPTGRFLFAANQDSNNIVVFKIDLATGKLSPTGDQYSASLPVCIVFLPVE